MNKVLLTVIFLIFSSGYIADYAMASPPPQGVFGDLPPNAEVHAIGVYENIRGVKVTRENVPIILVLTSHKKASWGITKTDNVNIVGVIVSGSGKQSVRGLAPNVKVINLSGKNRNSNSFQAYEKYGKGFDKLNKQVKELTGRELSSFQGNYKGWSFEISDETVFDQENSFMFNPDLTLPLDTEVHIVGVDRGKADKSYKPFAHGQVNKGLVDVEVKVGDKPILLVLTSPNPIKWTIVAKKSDNILGIILSGHGKHEVTGNISPKTEIMQQSIAGSEYETIGYILLTKKIKELTGLDVTSFRGGRKIEHILVKLGKYFPTEENFFITTGYVDYPAKSKIYNYASINNYIVPENCMEVSIMAWGGGGAQGSSSGFANNGGGGGYTYSEVKVEAGEILKIYVGGSGKIGSHVDQKNPNKESTPGKAGWPDGGNGSVGVNGTGGGGAVLVE